MVKVTCNACRGSGRVTSIFDIANWLPFTLPKFRASTCYGCGGRGYRWVEPKKRIHPHYRKK